MDVYENFGADGIVCAAIWDAGTAVISWDGRFQVDLNIFSLAGREAIDVFEKEFREKLPSLGGWLRDTQPRGYGRVVNFKEDMAGESNFFS